ncbi:hypothetical protein K432DRAFT_265099, partial [Lepidopterella palustris CBS 459.81]
PTIPPRPARTQNLPTSTAAMDIPRIPPRPKRSVERSVSPHRDTFARSPLNDPSFVHNGIYSHQKEDTLGSNLPQRPPSVTLPSIGQEGSEYANMQDFSADESSPKQTKNVAGDLPLYAPTASVPVSTAKSRIATVTRTDSSQAAAAGLGKLFSEADDKGETSGRSASSAGTHTRPQSIYKDDEEHGIPEIGIRVPMYPNAGDVQAPTPSPMQQGAPTGVGFFNNGSKPSGRHHGRTKSGREIFHGPPGSYGLHGHGVINHNDEFEKSWYQRHPDDFAKEKQGEYGRAVPESRKEYHWVGDDLSKLVHQSASRGIGMGTSREAIGTPDEQIGYMASEEYASRITSPRPSSIHAPKANSSGSQTESPLRKASLPVNQMDADGKPKSVGSEHALESEAEDDIIHIGPPSHRVSKIGGGGYDPPKEDLGPEGGNTEEEGGWIVERGYGVPILASDEVAKNPEAEFLLPAVSPELERRGSGEYTITEPDGVPSYLTGRRSTSRNSNRNIGAQKDSQGQSRFTSPSEHERIGTPLENVKEYEPLFPDDDEHEHKERPTKAVADKLKRPDLARHHFPSQDVWEDTPSSLQLQTTVDSPQAPEEPPTPGDHGAANDFETPETETNRKQELPDEDQESFLPDRTKRFAKSELKPDVLDDVSSSRPGTNQRFPSRDIWEDSPDHYQLVTTVSGPQTEETNQYAEDSPTKTEKPQIPARPSIPARPIQSKEILPADKKVPVIPDRPKPQIPARPGKLLSKTSSAEKVPTTSDATSTDASPAPPTKPKPAVPARPGGSKIAALKAGFMNDLNSRLQLGPQAPKVQEPAKEEQVEEQERAPLADARKGRAKGPQRRKPASSPSGAAVAEEKAPAAPKLEFVSACTVWEIAPEEEKVDVPAARMAEVLKVKV